MIDVPISELTKPACCENSFSSILILCFAALDLIVLYNLPPFSSLYFPYIFLAKKKSIWNHLISNFFRPHNRYLSYPPAFKIYDSFKFILVAIDQSTYSMYDD